MQHRHMIAGNVSQNYVNDVDRYPDLQFVCFVQVSPLQFVLPSQNCFLSALNASYGPTVTWWHEAVPTVDDHLLFLSGDLFFDKTTYSRLVNTQLPSYHILITSSLQNFNSTNIQYFMFSTLSNATVSNL